MNKKLIDLFVVKDNKIERLNNYTLKKILEFKYETIYKNFISEEKTIINDKELCNNFLVLDNLLDEMRGIKSDDYIIRVKEVALKYKDWMSKKVHLFNNKRNVLKNQK